ncbi:MAG: hypothetical protein ABSA72_10200 [Nitrososphaerales archaeon]|jgi:hypothetical protein
MGKNGVTGMIVPLEGETINRVLHHRPIIAIFVDEFPSDLEPGDRAFLYVTGGARILDAEGGVASVSREPVRDVRKYGTELSISAQELDEYVGRLGKSEDDEMLVLKIDAPTKYIKPMKCTKSIPRDGTYMTAETFFSILRENH